MCVYLYIYERENGKDGRQLPNPAQLTAKSDTQLDSQLEIKLSIICNNSTRQLSQDYMWPMTLFFFLTSTCMDSSECRFMNPCRCESVYVFWGLTKSRPTETDPKHPNKWYGEIFETWTKWKDHHPSQSSEVMYLLKMCFFLCKVSQRILFPFRCVLFEGLILRMYFAVWNLRLPMAEACGGFQMTCSKSNH